MIYSTQCEELKKTKKTTTSFFPKCEQQFILGGWKCDSQFYLPEGLVAWCESCQSLSQICPVVRKRGLLRVKRGSHTPDTGIQLLVSSY